MRQSIVNHALPVVMNQSSPPEPPTEGDNPVTEAPTDGANEVTSEQSSDAPITQATVDPAKPRPSIVFLLVVSVVSLALDLGTKWWALHTLEKTLPNGVAISKPVELTPWLTLLLARNRGGAWGLLQTANEEIRKPFFLIISVLAIGFIVYLYRKVHPKQHALKWGLPLVLGGAIGNLVDRIRYGWVIDFIDYRAAWVRWLNEQIARIWETHAVTDHWPTFNIADVAICVGVGLMAIDMFTSRKVAQHASQPAVSPAQEAAEPEAVTQPAPAEPDAPAEESKV